MASRFKTSCDFDEALFTSFKEHCQSSSPRVSVTAGLEACMREVLRVHGKLPGDPVSEIAAEAAELAKTLGAEAVREKLCELAGVGSVAAGGGR